MPFKTIREFIQLESASGILLLSVAVLALLADNSPLQPFYQAIFSHTFFAKSLLQWINEGLMSLFFLLVGLEIKREMFVGELNSVKKITLPAIAALSGMIVPAIIYSIFNWHNDLQLRGWAIPTATDIAFALGILNLLGHRIPLALKAFLTALAIFDDIGAVIIIVCFYSHSLSILFLSLSAICLLALGLLNYFHVKQLSLYLLIGILLWFCMLQSGVHAAISGVLLAFTIPFNGSKPGYTPLNILEQKLHPWVAFGVLPLFGFANAGISFSGMRLNDLWNPVTLGIVLGLFLGKQLGVFAAVWLAVKTKIAEIPKGANYWNLYGIALICGVGFTMSLFIGTLAFAGNSNYVTLMRLGVLSGSLISGALGYLWLRVIAVKV